MYMPQNKLSDKRDLDFPCVQIFNSSKVLHILCFYFYASGLKQKMEIMLKQKQLIAKFLD